MKIYLLKSSFSKLLLVIIVFHLFFLVTRKESYSFVIEPKLIIGSVMLKEKGVKEGNKFIVGTQLSFSGGEEIFWSLAPEFWKMGEPLDEDKEITNSGYSLHSQLGYRLKSGKWKITPVIGLNLGKLKREYQNEKWEDPNKSWTHLTHIYPTSGINVEYKFLYGNLNLIHQVWWKGNTTNQDSGKIDFGGSCPFIEAGVLVKNFSAGMFYRKMSFDQIESSTYLTGAVVGYKF